MHHPALGPRLVGDQPLAEQLLGGVAHLVLGAAELDAAGLAPGTGMDLGLHRPAGAPDLRGAVDRLLGAVGDPSRRHRDAEVGEEFLGLVLVNVHG